MVDSSGQAIRVTTNRKQADEWALVLASAGISSRQVWTTAGCHLVVSAAEIERARSALELYYQENRELSAGVVAIPEYGPTRAGVLVALSLVVFHVAIRSPPFADGWIRLGRASAMRILYGDWWRAVTALTLHADITHVLSNAVAMAIFGTALLSAVGPGLGLWLMLLAGAGGNAINAVLRGPGHNALGASTAIFGAVGVLGAIQVARRRHAGATTWRTWLPIGAALALLAFLGAGTNADVMAHLLGFVIGGALGLVLVAALPYPPGAGVQVALTFTATTLVVTCWVLALK